MESAATTSRQSVGTAGEAVGRSRTMPLPDGMLNIPCDSLFDFFKKWLRLLRQFISLTDKEIEVVSGFLVQRLELSKSITDQGILDTMLMSDEVKKRVVDMTGLTISYFYVIMSSLRTKGVIKDGILNPRLVPAFKLDSNGVFRLLVQFKQKQ